MSISSVTALGQVTFGVTYPVGIVNSTLLSYSSVTSNATDLSTQITGPRCIAMPVSMSLTPGRYWLGAAESVQRFGITLNQLFAWPAQYYLQAGTWNLFGPPVPSAAAIPMFSVAPAGTIPPTITLTGLTGGLNAVSTVPVPMFNFSGYTTGTNYL